MFNKSPIAKKLTILIVSFSTAITIITTGVQIFIDYKKELADIYAQIDTIKTMQVSPLSHSMWTFDSKGIQIIIDNILKIQGIEFLQVTIDDKHIWSGGRLASRKTIDSLMPISFLEGRETVKIGTLRIVASLDEVYSHLIRKTMVIFVGNGFKTFFVSLFVLFLFQRLVTRHVSDLGKYATQVAFGRTRTPFKLNRNWTKERRTDELDEAASAINLMRENLEKEVNELRQTKEALSESEEQFRHLSAATYEAIVFHDKGFILHANSQYYEMFGYSPEELSGIDAISATSTEESNTLIHQKISSGEMGPYEAVGLKKDGTEFPIEIQTKITELNNRKIRTAAIRDLTEKKKLVKEMSKLEKRIQHAQKMEAIGTLAGGIAHDFNNILSVIIGYTEMARDDSQPESTVANGLNEVLEASYRAKDLVQQILSFSRQDETERILIKPSVVVKKAIEMLRPSLPTTIEVTQDIDSETGHIFADPTQIHQIIMNLGTNAFHAMEKTGGNLNISLKEQNLSAEELVQEPNVAAGTFIQLTMSDSGPGIPSDIIYKIFDPYFTTKEVGKGTGMGLAIVHGIVKNYGGFISLHSEPGEGTTFHVFVPVEKQEILPETEIVKQVPVGRERILFIDDEAILAQMGKSMLERLGYHVTVQTNSIEALETFKKQPDLYDLIITDQTMPGMTGADIARRMMQIRPDIPIILCTGYSSIITEEEAKSFGIKEFALKPFTKSDIAVLIRKVLDRP